MVYQHLKHSVILDNFNLRNDLVSACDTYAKVNGLYRNVAVAELLQLGIAVSLGLQINIDILDIQHKTSKILAISKQAFVNNNFPINKDMKNNDLLKELLNG